MNIGQGVIHGGWEYVWIAYGVTWAVLALYSFSVMRRAGREARREVRR